MSRLIANDGEWIVVPRSIWFDGFDISWVGESPFENSICLGYEDGRIKFANIDSLLGPAPIQIATSGEAINGVAFSDGRMVVSTRSEVVVVDGWRDGDGPLRALTYPGGAHDVIPIGSGRFVAPLGIDGLLHVESPIDGGKTVELTRSETSDRLNYYRVASLGVSSGTDVLACAVRREGIATIALDPSGSDGNTSLLTLPGLDVVDLCSLRSETLPLAFVALGRDRSIVLSRNAITDQNPSYMSFDDWEGTAYRVMCSEGGHLFVLTSEAIYSIPKLVTRFVEGSLAAGRETIRSTKLQAVDAYLVYDRLMIVMTDKVNMLDVEAVWAGSGTDSRMSIQTRTDWLPTAQHPITFLQQAS